MPGKGNLPLTCWPGRVQETSKQHRLLSLLLVACIRPYCRRHHTLQTQDLKKSSWRWPGSLLPKGSLLVSGGAMQAPKGMGERYQLSDPVVSLRTPTMTRPARQPQKYIGGTAVSEVTNSCLIEHQPAQLEGSRSWHWKSSRESILERSKAPENLSLPYSWGSVVSAAVQMLTPVGDHSSRPSTKKHLPAEDRGR